ncbi:YbgA family protein [Cellulosilyticum sp. I15G10I2]|uniref:YbgA family protein n=1 Tax=Cellulosilyticum sp. I15G10I2 TaxID=1892843 RepID=UPI00085C6AAB|nr:DUF523 and DUF1722 domain-containing protein [Cellulosilyticum sp. I15G10I2]
MRKFKSPTILLSSCIEGQACRYDGSSSTCPFVMRLKPYAKWITVCPEVAIGLPIPRQTLRIISDKENNKRLVFSKTGEDVTEAMQAFSNTFLEELISKEVDGIILKGRSPSCGIKDVKMYENYGKASSMPKKTSGIFAEKLLENFSQIAIEDEGRLMNYTIREHFYTRIFTIAEFRGIKQKKSIKALIKFHSDNKYLLMAYSPANLKKLGKLVANNEKRDIENLLDVYEVYLNKALATAVGPMRNVNMLLHLFGYFSKNVSQHEKAFFLDNLESYGNKKVPFSVPLALIHGWVIRFENEYLMNQTIFEAFPADLTEVTDSGKGI